jgi:hypothetical protein
MQATIDKAVLVRPQALNILAAIFILAPFCNLILSLATSGVADWYRLSILWPLLQSISWVDWLWLGLLPLTGILFYSQHKTAWSFAVITLSLVLAANTYRALHLDPTSDNTFIKLQIGMSMVVTFSVLMLSFYFRFPYLDRRAGWFFPTAHRYALQTSVQVVAESIYAGVTDSLSHSGARVLLQEDYVEGSKQLKFVDLIFEQIQGLKIKCEVIEIRSKVLRLRFTDVDFKQKLILQQWLKKAYKEASKEASNKTA